MFCLKQKFVIVPRTAALHNALRVSHPKAQPCTHGGIRNADGEAHIRAARHGAKRGAETRPNGIMQNTFEHESPFGECLLNSGEHLGIQRFILFCRPLPGKIARHAALDEARPKVLIPVIIGHCMLYCKKQLMRVVVEE